MLTNLVIGFIGTSPAGDTSYVDTKATKDSVLGFELFLEKLSADSMPLRFRRLALHEIMGHLLHFWWSTKNTAAKAASSN